MSDTTLLLIDSMRFGMETPTVDLHNVLYVDQFLFRFCVFVVTTHLVEYAQCFLHVRIILPFTRLGVLRGLRKGAASFTIEGF